MAHTDRAVLRRQLRTKRQSLSTQQQRLAANRLRRNIYRHQLLRRHQHLAFYLANDGEIDPSELLAAAHRHGRHCYLPVLMPGNRLRFIRYRPGDRLNENRFGIPEPLSHRPHIKPWVLGMVFVPLVGFDRQGGRLGMGGGFYDRSFAFKQRQRSNGNPQLIGLAHDCQEVEQLDVKSWDIPLTKIVTDREVITAGDDKKGR